jgi:hypothetical protein
MTAEKNELNVEKENENKKKEETKQDKNLNVELNLNFKKLLQVNRPRSQPNNSNLV